MTRAPAFTPNLRSSVAPTAIRRTGVALLLMAVLLGSLRPTAAQPLPEVEFYDAEAAAIRRAVDHVASAVVQVEVVGVAEVAGSAGGEIAADAPSAGTIVDSEGFILATSIVTARPAASILVVLADGTRLAARIVAEDKGRELVMLKVESPEPLPTIEFTPAPSIEVGQYAIAVGRMRHDGPAARSIGIISAVDRLDGRALQTDARISPPFYGGPLVNIRGQLLGIVVPAMPELGGTGDKAGWYDAGIAFAAPAGQVAARLERMKQGESIQPGKLGIVAASSDPLADGTEISAVRIGSPASEAGIEPGDVIASINGIVVSRHAQIKQVLGPLDAGTPITLVLRRGETELTVTPTLVAEIPPFEPQTLGMLITEAEEQLSVAAVFPGSPADRAGIMAGDVLQSVAGSEVGQLDDLRKRVMTLRGGSETTVVVLREGEAQTITLQPQSIAGALVSELPSLPGGPVEGKWSVAPLTLADVPNKAAMIAPGEKPSDTPLGLLVVFAKPGVENVEEALEAWRQDAEQSHVIVAMLSSGDPQRWNAEEAELGTRVAAMVRKRYTIQPFATAATGDGAGGSIAMIAAFADPTTFSGVAIAADVKPPAIQLRENDPTAPIHVMLRGSGTPPGWANVLERVGYAIVDGAGSPAAVMRFVWSLGQI